MKPLRIPLIEAPFKEIRTILFGSFRQRLLEAGVEQVDVDEWETAIFHVLEAFEWNLKNLVDVLQQDDPEKIVENIHSWTALTTDITVFQIESVLDGFAERLEKYIPPDIYDDEKEEEQNE